MCQQCERQRASDRLMWQVVRRALLMIVAGIEQRYGGGKNDQRTA